MWRFPARQSSPSFIGADGEKRPPRVAGRLPVARQIETAVPRGAGSCAATACHGSIMPLGGEILRNEHTTWITKDPHAEAYQTLFSDRSRAIARNLSGGKVPAHKEAALPGLSRDLRRRPPRGRGPPAGRGRLRVVPRPFREVDRPPYDARLVLDLPDATRSIATAWCRCATWTAGPRSAPAVTSDRPPRAESPLRDVDHDLIAAGHPRLTFEFSAYQAIAAASLGREGHQRGRRFLRPMLGGRPGGLGAGGPRPARRPRPPRGEPRSAREEPASWPEFSEYGCFSCHHDLRDEPWRREARAGPDPPGGPEVGIVVLSDDARPGEAGSQRWPRQGNPGARRLDGSAGGRSRRRSRTKADAAKPAIRRLAQRRSRTRDMTSASSRA